MAPPAQLSDVVQNGMMSTSPSEVAVLSWALLIPDLPDIFSVDTSDPCYRLYQDAIQHLDILPSPSPHTCARQRNPSVLQIHSSFHKLAHLLADLSAGLTVSLDDFTQVSPSQSVIDFLYLGVHYVASMNLSIDQDSRSPQFYCIGCLLRQTETLPEDMLYQAEFLDVLTVLWEKECTIRQSTRELEESMPPQIQDATHDTTAGHGRSVSSYISARV